MYTTSTQLLQIATTKINGEKLHTFTKPGLAIRMHLITKNNYIIKYYYKLRKNFAK